MLRAIPILALFIFFTSRLFGDNPVADRFFEEGYTAYIHREYDKALAGFEKFIDEEKESRSPRLDKIAMMHGYRASCFKNLRLYPLSIRELHEAGNIYELLNDTAKSALMLERQASVFAQQGKTGQAILFFEDALKYYQSIRWLSAIETISMELAQIYFRNNHFAEVRKYIKQAQVVRNESDLRFENTYQEADMFYLLGKMALAENNLHESGRLFQKADSTAEYFAASLPEKRELQLHIWLARAAHARLSGDYTLSSGFLSKAQMYASRHSLDSPGPLILMEQARWHEALGDTGKVTRLHREVSARYTLEDGSMIQQDRGNYRDIVRDIVRYNEHLFHQTGNSNYLIRKLEILEGLVLLARPDESDYSLFSDFVLLGEADYPFYRELVGTAIEIWLATGEIIYLSKALYFSELGHMQMLQSSLRQSLQIRITGEKADQLASLASLRSRINQMVIRTESGTLERDQGQAMLVKLLDEMEKLRTRTGKTYLPDIGAAATFNEYLLPNLQQQLEDEELYMKFIDTGEVIYLMLISAKEVKVHTIRVTPDLESAVGNFNRLITGENPLLTDLHDMQIFCREGHFLYTYLFKPLEKMIRGKRLFIEAGGLLENMAFEALLTREYLPKKVSFRELPFMIRDFDLMFPSSAGFFLGSRTAPPKPMKYAYAGLAPFSASLTEKSHLPGSGREVTEAGKMLSGKSWTGEEVSKSRLISLSDQCNILHVASHARRNNWYPQLSELILNPGDNQHEGAESLYFYEILTNTWEQQLILLGACGSSEGEYVPNYGTISLANAFLASGAQSVIAANWQVDDQASSRILSGFFTQIKAGTGFHEALRTAKLGLIEGPDERFAHPHFWAVYTYSGHTQKLLPVKPAGYFFPLLAILLVLGLVAYFFYHRLRH